jgi:DNA-binding response OmpR family regulator
MLPRMDGLTVCRRIRAQSEVPVLILSAKAEEVNIVSGLEVGADDYVPKPFRVNELLARVRALLRRAERNGAAQPTPAAAPAAQPTAAAPAKPDEKDPMICRYEKPIGSLLPKKSCASKSVREQAERLGREDVEAVQRNARGPFKTEPSGP